MPEHAYGAVHVEWDEDSEGNGWQFWARECSVCGHAERGMNEGDGPPFPQRSNEPPPIGVVWCTDETCECRQCKGEPRRERPTCPGAS